MGVLPSGAIVARPVLARACGCLQEFQYYEVDKFRVQRQAKFQRTRCPTCVAKLVEQQRLATTLPKKGEAFRQLPPGTKISLTCRAGGTWAGELIADGTTVETIGDSPSAVTVALARLWLVGRVATDAK